MLAILSGDGYVPGTDGLVVVVEPDGDICSFGALIVQGPAFGAPFVVFVIGVAVFEVDADDPARKRVSCLSVSHRYQRTRALHDPQQSKPL